MIRCSIVWHENFTRNVIKIYNYNYYDVRIEQFGN